MRCVALGLACCLLVGAPASADAAVCPPPDDDLAMLLDCVERSIDRREFRRARKWIDRAGNLAQGLDAASPHRLSLLAREAHWYDEQGDPAAAAAIYAPALRGAESELGARHRVVARLSEEQARWLERAGDVEAAIVAARRAVAIRELHAQDDAGRHLLRSGRNRLGRLLLLAGDTAGATASFEGVVELSDWEPAPHLLHVARSLARLYADAGRVDEAARTYELALRSGAMHHAAGDPALVALLDELAALEPRAPGALARAERLTLEIDPTTTNPTRLRPRAAPETGRIYRAGSDGVTNPRRQDASYVAPTYPERARRDRVEGRVILQAVIDAAGTVGPVELLRCSNPDFGFEAAAIDAVKQWRYEPATLKGWAVPTYFTIVVAFELN